MGDLCSLVLQIFNYSSNFQKHQTMSRHVQFHKCKFARRKLTCTVHVHDDCTSIEWTGQIVTTPVTRKFSSKVMQELAHCARQSLLNPPEPAKTSVRPAAKFLKSLDTVFETVEGPIKWSAILESHPYPLSVNALMRWSNNKGRKA